MKKNVNKANWFNSKPTLLFISIITSFVFVILVFNACNDEEEFKETDISNISLEVRSESDCYDPDEAIPECFEYGLLNDNIDTIEIDENCKIEVRWDESFCYTIGKRIVVIENFEYTILDGECLQQIQYWEQLEANGQTQELADALDAFEYEASLILEMKRIEDYIDSWGVPLCQGTQSIIMAEYYSNVCFQYSPGPSAGPRPDFTNIVKWPCGLVCCKRSAKYCMDNGGLIRIDLGFELSGNDCSEEPLDPNRVEVSWGTCDHDCSTY